MSKITELRRQATDAVRARRWDKAVELYERVCELDSGNASYRNELGDVYLKMGEVGMAVTAFVSAADLYNGVGLTNNAVAVHKKILRHDPNHLDSIWGLGEIRLEQGLETDATTAFLDFLNRAEGLGADRRRPYEARCFDLLDRLGSDPQILSGLETAFEHWGMEDGQAQVLLAKALLAVEAGEDDIAEKYVERARSICEDIETLPAWGEYVRRTTHAMMNAETSGPVSAVAMPVESAPAETPDAQTAAVPAAAPLAADEEAPTSTPAARLEIDDSDLDLGFDFSAQQNAAESSPAEVPAPPAPTVPEADEPPVAPADSAPPSTGTHAVDDIVLEPAAASTPPAAPASAPDAAPVPEPDDGVDLLEQLLAEGDLDIQGDEQQQLDMIAREMEGQIAGSVDADDHAGQYELGVVYMDMGLFDQAIAAFDRAAAGAEQQLKAVEMKGTCLLKLARSDEAMANFQEGLAVPGYPARYYLGLLYGVGACHEAAGQLLEAIDYFERVAAVDERFQDVSSRLASLQQLIADDG